ncbi:MAG: hypothetical protein ACR2IE_20125 [Candidatus Sumerlaeaceae bacterium]
MPRKTHRRASHSRTTTELALAPSPPLGIVRLLLPALLTLVLVLFVFVPVEEYDLWFHLAFAKYLQTNGHFPPGDVFSSTSFGREWISTGWLGSVLLNWLWEHAGHARNVAPICIFIFAQIAAGYLAIYVFAARRGLHLAAFVLLLPAIMTASLRFNARPDVASQLCIGLLLIILSSVEHPIDRPTAASRSPAATAPIPWQLYLLPPLIALWANLHVGFMAGLMPLAAFGLQRALEWRKTHHRTNAAAALLCALSCFSWMLNPYGWTLLKLPGKISSVPGITQMLFEWMPLFQPPHNLPALTYALLALLLLLVGAIIATSPRKPRAWEILTALFVLAITWNARRQLALTCVALPILALPYAGRFNQIIARRKTWAIAGACSATAAALAIKISGMLVTGGWPSARMLDNTFPSGAVQFLLKHRPPDNMFNSYHYGAYLLYHLGPETKVFIDGRVDTYDAQVFVDDRAIEAGQMTLEQAEAKYKLNTWVLDARPGYDPGQMVRRLAANPKYVPVFADASAIVFVRRAPETAAYLQKIGKP